jgi:hypothetical protein
MGVTLPELFIAVDGLFYTAWAEMHDEHAVELVKHPLDLTGNSLPCSWQQQMILLVSDILQVSKNTTNRDSP